MTTTMTHQDVCTRSECGEGNVHFRANASLRELQRFPHCVDQYKATALLAFIAAASHHGLALDPNSLQFAEGPVAGPEVWADGETPEWLPCAEEDATHRALHWRMDMRP